MTPYTFQPWFLFGWVGHFIFMVVALVGVVLFVAWALRQREEALKTWMIWILVVGVLGVLLTSQFSFSPWGMGFGGSSQGQMQNMMNMMMQGMMGNNKAGMMGNNAGGMMGNGGSGMMGNTWGGNDGK